MPSSRKLNWWEIILLFCAAALSVGGYLLAAHFFYRSGFPLDDAWIHQTFARNLAAGQGWSFQAGIPSGGSTSPLWTILLAAGCWLGIDPLGWAFLLGILALFGLAVAGEAALRRMMPAWNPHLPWAGLFLCLEWHLVWAAGSGMETLLFALVATLLLTDLMDSGHYARLGLLCGIALWLRPEGVTLLAPVMLLAVVKGGSWRGRTSAILKTVFVFSALLLPYLIFHLSLEGQPLPNTFFAKQEEYASLLQVPFIRRLSSLALQPLLGAGLILLPAALVHLVKGLRARNWGLLAASLWAAGLVLVYALLLPATYQSGRYLVPLMPAFFLWGLAGLAGMFGGMAAGRRRSLLLAWTAAAGAVLLAFWWRGLQTYRQDVAVIESEMVQTAHWLAGSLPPDSRLAVHDIGAIGYYSGQSLVDLAGLISPEVIPFIRDEQQLGEYLDSQDVDYLVTFPDWYPLLTEGRIPLYVTGSPFSAAQGHSNMAVYAWP